MASVIVLFGLGNPGSQYRWTPHNLGFHVLDLVASRHGAVWTADTRSYVRAACKIGAKDVVLVQPQSFVNRSGKSLRDLSERYEFVADDLLVVADDIALPFGQLRLRRRGSDGGHNGLKSVIDALGTTSFARLRMGVGPVPERVDPADYVTRPLASDERRVAEMLVERAAACVADVIERGFDVAMNLHNVSPPETD